MKTGRTTLRVLAGLALAGLVAWGSLALYYLGPGPAAARAAEAAASAVLGLLALAGWGFRRRWQWPALAVFGAVWLGALTAYFSTEPSNGRDWTEDVAILPYATLEGDRVTVHRIRHFDYRTETDFTPGWYDKTFDLRKLDRVDLIASYWMGPHIAHMFLSFGFGADHLAISIEARRDRHRPYGTLPGFFRQYELVYVVADERDAIRLRTNIRKDPPEQVFLYELRGTDAERRRLFLGYLRDINALRDRPRFYHTLTTNCTTMILSHTRVDLWQAHGAWKTVLSGHAAEFAYDRGRLDQSLPFSELQALSQINAAAMAADQAPDFSRRIRAGLPRPAP